MYQDWQEQVFFCDDSCLNEADQFPLCLFMTEVATVNVEFDVFQLFPDVCLPRADREIYKNMIK